MDSVENILNTLFKQLKIKAHVFKSKTEESFLIVDLKLDSGGTFKKIESYSTEIALALKSLKEPLIYPITKEGIVRMEIMISELESVYFSDIIKSKDFENSNYKIPLALGSMRNGENLIVDLITMPHLLIGGATGSGKSIMLHTIINSVIQGKNAFQLALIDPKRVEFSYYSNLPYLFGPIAKDLKDTLALLQKISNEMDRRFFVLEKARCRDISYYKGRMPYLIVVIDELADLMMAAKKDVQELVCRLAQKSRACGIHLVVATQRPSVDVITGLIKANFPSRISCQVSSNVDSRTILDKAGAEKLFGKGDAIIDCSQFRFKRFKGSFIDKDYIISNTKRTKTWWSKIWNL